MIATDGPCAPQRLVELLAAGLNIAEERRTVAHLDRCARCRAELQRLAGSQALWQETRDVLSEATELSVAPDRSHFESGLQAGDAARWVSGLLQPSDDPQTLGELDGRTVHAVIGQGGMGVVLKVWDTELQRPLAVKLLSPMLASTGAARQRFFREAQAAAAVVHPNIVPIYAVTSDGPLPYIVMPLVGGGSLQQRIERVGPLALPELLSFGLQIAEALSAAHAQGLVHRDIKPANILLDSGGHRVLLSDFGLARALDDASMTASGLIAGTPNYMSPEQARGESVDLRSDLYSLGAVLYTMATGHPPARGDSPLAVLRRVTEEKPLPVHALNESLPLWLHPVIEHFLQKDIESRIPTAEAAAKLLRGCLAHVRAPARNALPAGVIDRRWFARPNRLLKPLAVLATFAAGIGSAGWLSPQPSSNNYTATRTAILNANATQPEVVSPPPSTVPSIEAFESSELQRQLQQLQWEFTELNNQLQFQPRH